MRIGSRIVKLDRSARRGAVAAAFCLLAAPALAQSPPQIVLGVGQYDQRWLDLEAGPLEISTNDRRFRAVDLRAEYRFSPVLSAGEWLAVRPFLGVEGTSDLALYGLGGLAVDLRLGPVVLTPSFGAGLYHRGDGKDLGSPVEFRSMLELGYEFAGGYRASIAYSHVSNADLAETNPGANVIGAYLHLPASLILGD